MGKKRTKEDVDSLPWKEIRKRSKTESIRSIYEHLVKPLGKCGLTTFRQWCVVKHIHSPFSEDAKKQFTDSKNSNRSYSEKDDKLIAKMRCSTPRSTYREIGVKLGRSPGAIEARAKRLQSAGKMPSRLQGWKKQEEAILIDCLRKSMTYEQIGKKLNRSDGGIRRHVYELKQAGIIDNIDRKTKAGPQQITSCLHDVDWPEVIAWLDASESRTQKIARFKFCKVANQSAFNTRLKEEREKLEAAKPGIRIIPVAQHKQLKPMWGQWAA